MIPVVGPFLVLGLVAWVAAIAVGVGAWFGVTRWQDRWALAGALAGLGTFELYLAAHGGLLPVLVFDPRYVLPATAALFVGGGVAVAYGTLFTPRLTRPPALEPGSPEEMLWLDEAVDRMRPRRLDWVLTAALCLPGVGLLQLGLTSGAGVGLVAGAILALAGPVCAAVGLVRRGQALRRLTPHAAPAIVFHDPGEEIR